MLVLLLFLCLSAPLATAEDTLAVRDTIRAGDPLLQRPAEPLKKITRPTRFYGALFGTFGRNADQFFDDYKNYLGGVSSTFDAPLGIAAGMSSFQIPDVGFGVAVSYSRSAIRETYLFKSFLDSTRPEQSTSQNMTVSVVPVMLTLDYFPTDRQFTTYVGLLAGIAFTSIKWTETLALTTLPGSRASGERYDESHVSPAIGARAGVSLGWDSRPDAPVLPALFIEASYTLIPVSAPIMEEVAKTFPTAPARMRESYSMQAGGFGIHLGISLLVH